MKALEISQSYLGIINIPKNPVGNITFPIIWITIAFTIYSQVKLVLESKDKPELIIDTTTELVQMFMELCRTSCYFYYRDELVQLYQIIEVQLSEIQKGPFYKFYQPVEKFADNITKYYSATFLASVIIYGVFPLFFHLYDIIKCSCFDNAQFPMNGIYHLENISVIEFALAYTFTVFVVSICCFVLVTVDTTFFVTTLHVMANVRVLAIEIKDAGEKENYIESVESMEKYIEKHVRLFDLMRRLQKINSFPLFIQCLTKGCTICLITFNLAMTQGNSDNIRKTFYVAEIILQLFISTYFGTMLTTEFEALAQTIYNANWYDQSPKSRRMYLTMLTMAQKPVKLVGWHMIDCNVETLRKTLSMAASLFTLLKSIVEA